MNNLIVYGETDCTFISNGNDYMSDTTDYVELPDVIVKYYREVVIKYD